MELKAREGLMGLFHAGVTWRAFACLVSLATAVAVETEKSLRIGNNRFVPDLIVRCARTHRILLVVEVWHTHTVSAKKKMAFRTAGIPWIEARSWHVISRTRRQPLPILDWAGPGLPQPPEQHPLFELEDDPRSLLRIAALPSNYRQIQLGRVAAEASPTPIEEAGRTRQEVSSSI